VLWDWLPHDLSVARTIFRCEPSRAAAQSLSGGTFPTDALVTFTRTGAVLIPVTLTCYPDANGDTAIIYADPTAPVIP